MDNPDFALACPAPLPDKTVVTMAHGGGGRAMQHLIEGMFASSFELADASTRHDSAILNVQGSNRLAFTTDSYVVHPLEFRGGDIGKLAICGTVNDLAMAGATPRWISVGFILEEGLPLDTLRRIVHSMRAAALHAGVSIVTGDTKVVDSGKGDGIFINTSGVGVMEHDHEIDPGKVRVGDAILLSGDVGRHGMAIMTQREGLLFESEIDSDCAALNGPATALLQAGIAVHCMRDLTRGGLASALVEIAEACGRCIHIEEAAVPVRDDVMAACELLGMDPMYVANEGRFVAFVPQEQASLALEILRQFEPSAGAVAIGTVTAETGGMVHLRSRIGVNRIMDMLSGEQLPRIC